MPLNEEGLIDRVSIRHSVSSDAVRTILQALRSSGGNMAQFSHPDFGGMSQWSPGMSMVGEMFNTSLKSKLDAVCTELAAYVTQTASTDQGRGRDDPEISYRAARQGSDWWPVNFGTPSAVGTQNDLQYAVFPGTGRLAIKDGRRIEIYDTGKHRIFGVAQAQSVDQTLTFTSQDGLVRITDLRKVETKQGSWSTPLPHLIREYTSLKIGWSDLNDVQEAGQYPFRDGVITVLKLEIAIWRKHPEALFTLMRKNPIRDRVEYVLGKHEFPSGDAG